MDATVIAFAGRITAIEYFLVTIMANEFHRRVDGEEQLLAFAEQMLHALKFRTQAPVNANPDHAMAVQSTAIAAAQKLLSDTTDLFVALERTRAGPAR